MGRSASSIQAEITIRETFATDASSRIASTTADGTTVTFISAEFNAKRLDTLYQQLDRANGTRPMFVRGVVTGLRR